MKPHFPLLILTLLYLSTLTNAAEESPARAVVGKVLEFGLMEPVGARKTVADANHTLSGTNETASDVRFIKQTDQVPAKAHTLFGFRYQINGVTEEGPVTLKILKTHPPLKNLKGEMQERETYPAKWSAKNGKLNAICGYRLRSEDLVPGVWTFEIWYHDEKVLSQSFTVVAP